MRGTKLLAENNYSCPDNLCCSSNGWCGSDWDYCGPGCQSKFGSCTALGPDSPLPTVVDKQCGPKLGICGNGQCCSAFGWCGTTADYCAYGCQADFGACLPPKNYISATYSSGVATPTNPSGQCGPGLGVCAAGQCCSPAGWCGTTADYCDAGCQPEYGTCLAPSQYPTNPAPAPVTGAGGQCGLGVGSCGDNECCSPAGWCGTGPSYCTSPDCQLGFGVCDADTLPSGVNTSTVVRTLVGSLPYGQLISDCNDPGHVALTFDDGPGPYTDTLLTILEKYNVKATFFITGNNNNKGPINSPDLPWRKVISRAYEAGHQIASHSWSHADFNAIPVWRQHEEIISNEVAINDIIGKFPTYFRPPYSRCDATCLHTMKEFGYHVILFDLDTEDYLNTQGDKIVNSEKIVKDFFQGQTKSQFDALAIEHDIHETTVDDLIPYMLDLLVTKLGYELVTVGQCLGDPKENWYRSVSDGHSTSLVSTSTSTTFTETTSKPSTSVKSTTAKSTSTKTITTKPTSTKTTSMKTTSAKTASMKGTFTKSTSTKPHSLTTATSTSYSATSTSSTSSASLNPLTSLLSSSLTLPTTTNPTTHTKLTASTSTSTNSGSASSSSSTVLTSLTDSTSTSASTTGAATTSTTSTTSSVSTSLTFTTSFGYYHNTTLPSSQWSASSTSSDSFTTECPAITTSWTTTTMITYETIPVKPIS
ncbi:hypothetical protein V1512DRAFT_30622 [Lipomyces arxii]|uniref:uncharacterized protein n=1 Tax=Lipomyces arxii TaxID=56418 RepID=UPI0034CFA6E1